MIDFACKTFKIEEIIKCGLGLTRADMKVFEYFLDEIDEWFTTEALSKRLGFDLSTIQKSVKRLSEKNVIKRSQKNIEGGGYFFEYTSKEKPAIREIMNNIVKNWATRVETELDKW